MTASFGTLYPLLFGLGFFVAPVMLVWGWVRWVSKRPRTRGICSILSLIGLSFATASALFALWIILFAESSGFVGPPPTFQTNYEFFYKCVSLGALVSSLGIVFSVGGVWRPNSVRWFSLAGAVGTLAFWLLATTWP